MHLCTYVCNVSYIPVQVAVHHASSDPEGLGVPEKTKAAACDECNSKSQWLKARKAEKWRSNTGLACHCPVEYVYLYFFIYTYI